MYRALALKALESSTPLDDEASLLALARASRIELKPTAQGNIVLLDGHDVSHRVRRAMSPRPLRGSAFIPGCGSGW